MNCHSNNNITVATIKQGCSRWKYPRFRLFSDILWGNDLKDKVIIPPPTYIYRTVRNTYVTCVGCQIGEGEEKGVIHFNSILCSHAFRKNYSLPCILPYLFIFRYYFFICLCGRVGDKFCYCLLPCGKIISWEVRITATTEIRRDR